MASTEGNKASAKKFDTTTPLDRRTLRAWVEHLAGQLKETDSLEITLTSHEGTGRRTTSFQAPVNPMYNICPGRHGLPPEPDSEPKPGGRGRR